MLQQIKKKEETVKRNVKLRQEIEYSCKKNKINRQYRNPNLNPSPH